ncbi:MAG: OadG family protein [Roseburia sp.]|nr:OadG family protein [Roseburia sp.]
MTDMFLSASDISVSDAAVRALVGFLIVLAVLALLVGIFYLSGFLFRTKFLSKDKLFSFGKKNKSKEPSEAAEEHFSGEDDEETVAAITAAITVLMSEDGNAAPEFVIRRISRKK